MTWLYVVASLGCIGLIRAGLNLADAGKPTVWLGVAGLVLVVAAVVGREKP